MLRLQNVSKTFFPGTPNARRALSDIDLHLAPGEFVSVIGGNGAGKSTLMNAIAGSFWVDSGHIMLDGADITYRKEYQRARNIGRLFQDPLRGTAPNMTIEENLALAYLRPTGKRLGFGISRQQRAYFRERLSELGLGLEDRLGTKVGLLSGGQRQALTLLMATLVPPKLLLLDEHTAALDPATAEKVIRLTCDIVARDKLTCLMITHDMSAALALGSRTLMMEDGHIILDISGPERAQMTVDDLLERFRQRSGHRLDNDRMLLR